MKTGYYLKQIFIGSVKNSAMVLAFVSVTSMAEELYSPYVEKNFPSEVYWGDTHLHTNLSFDSYGFGNTNLGPSEAYRFAKGMAVPNNQGELKKLDRPLDFLVVADHANNMGVFNALVNRNPLLKSSMSDNARRWSSLLATIRSNKLGALAAKNQIIDEAHNKWSVGGDSFKESVWHEITASADVHNAPGKFTAFIGYEWTMPFYRLHRVLVFKDDANKANQVLPFSQFDSLDPEKLWAYMDNYEKQTGGEVLAIPHNANLSQGVMFSLEDAKGNPLSKQYAKSRSRWEPLFEVVQNKGDSEAHPIISPNDEFADFKKIDTSKAYDYPDDLKELRQLSDYGYESWIEKSRREKGPNWKYQHEYARPVLKLGLRQEQMLGANPFKFGLIGSTDAHASFSSIGNSGLNSTLVDIRERQGNTKGIGGMQPNWMGSGGYAAIWAQENTRESLFAAMKRKEVYATSGPRIKVRFFGGWGYTASDALRPDLAKIGYQKGIPMGGDLTNAPEGKNPNFLIHAVRDPEGANLDRVQVIKGWLDNQGELHEKVFNVSLSDNRQEIAQGVVSVGTTVQLDEGSYINSIGDPELAVVWEDESFNEGERAFYYVRVLQITTPTRVAYDAEVFDWELDITDETPMTVQERAYSSPIWYTPTDK